TRRRVRGAIFAACVLLMFVLGLGMRGKLYDLEFDEPLHVFAFVAEIGTGLFYWIAERLNLGLGTMTWPSYDYGTTYLWVAGLLNYLIVLDAFDIRKAGNHDPFPLHRIAPVRSVCLDRLCPDYQKRAARTIPLRRFCLFIFSRRRLRCRLDHVSAAAIEMTS